MSNPKSKIKLLGLLILITLILSGCTPLTTKKAPADGGIFKSTDFGENWSQKAQGIANSDMRFMVFDPQDENTAYVSFNGAGVYKTIDSGETWQGTTISSGTFQDLAIDHLNTSVIYAINGNKIIKSVDAMTTWFDIYVEVRPDQYLLDLLTDPYNSNILYASTTSSIIKSTDYGNSWKLLSWREPKIKKLYQSYKNNDTLYAWTDKGLYKSTNGAVDWADFNQGLTKFSASTNLNWIDFDPRTEIIYSATTNSILQSTDGGSTWKEIPTLFDFKKVSIKSIVYNPKNLNEIIFPYNNTLLKTDNGGKTWKSLKSIPTQRGITYLIVDPYHTDSIFAGTTQPPKTK
jgi:photosystem II stability/assembly factor-like uncharacterized protein